MGFSWMLVGVGGSSCASLTCTLQRAHRVSDSWCRGLSPNTQEAASPAPFEAGAVIAALIAATALVGWAEPRLARPGPASPQPPGAALDVGRLQSLSLMPVVS